MKVIQIIGILCSLFFQLNVFEFTDLEDLQIFIKRYIYLVSPVLSVIYFLVEIWPQHSTWYVNIIIAQIYSSHTVGLCNTLHIHTHILIHTYKNTHTYTYVHFTNPTSVNQQLNMKQVKSKHHTSMNDITNITDMIQK
jgi:hypothetical protein